MENASKALIIAGAILLSILIIALGMRIYNSANSSSQNSDLSAQEVQSFNSSFESYEGRQKGSAVRSLISAIINNNQEQPDRNITYNLKQGDLKTNKIYEVKFDYNDDGLINGVKVYDGNNEVTSNTSTTGNGVT